MYSGTSYEMYIGECLCTVMLMINVCFLVGLGDSSGRQILFRLILYSEPVILFLSSILLFY